jgi:hypothetical protein
MTRLAPSPTFKSQQHPGLSRGGLLQRNCACGNHTMAGGECAQCSKSKRRGLQAKLKVNEPGDSYEQEADRIADQVMATPSHARASGAAPRIQRVSGSSSGSMETAPTSVDQVLSDSGRPLDPPLRRDMEQRFDYDFSRVRVHTGTAAEQSARDLDAHAYTAGHDIVFGAGRFEPGTYDGRRLIAHELAHVVQQSATGEDNARQRTGKALSSIAPASYSLRVIDPQGGEKLIRPPIPNVIHATTGARGEAAVGSTEPKEEEADNLTLRRSSTDGATPTLYIQRAATFTKPTVKADNPIVRVLKGLTPGLTTPEINGTKSPSGQQLFTALSPTKVKQTASSGGAVSCQFDSFHLATTAEQIVATAAPPGGWTATVGPASGLSSEAKCAKVAKLPIAMNALPNNADFVKRVQNSEDEHVAYLKWLHDRYLAPYDAFVNGLSGSGKDLPACAQDLAGKLGFRPTEAASAFSYGWATSLEKLDGPLGTHTDTARIDTNKDCSAATLTVNQPSAPKAGAGPGNVTTVKPTVTNFDPTKLTVVGNDLKEGKTVVKSFGNAADAKSALGVIQHYGMTSRNVIGSLEYFLVNGAAPSGALKAANEFAIDPTRYQVTFDFPNAGEWAITDISTVATGINVNVIAGFGASRDEAYSAWAVLQSFGFAWKGWVGGTRQKPAMSYFRV